jgi:N-acetylmuramoyl-L-alanine amidase
MIDPGHGGEDYGRRNPDGLREKDLALQFAKALQQEIEGRPGYRAELTRKGDFFVSLADRRKIAEDAGAHLFVSLHLNAAPSRKARGTEVFFVSLQGATDRALKELEEIENSADLAGGILPIETETSPDVAKMLVDLRQNDSVERSQRLATLLTDNVERVRGMETRRVKQAGFAVLKSLFIPAVLVEIGFLTNPDDLRFVRSRSHREQYVEALADGIVSYCEEIEIPRVGWKMHTVSPGETISGIASHYSMDESALRRANGIPDGKDGRDFTGKKLRVRAR